MKLDIKDCFFSLVGRRGSGKTEMISYLIKSQRGHFSEVFVISPSSFSGAWDGIVPKSNVMQEFKEEWVSALIQRMTTANEGKTKDSKGFKRVLLVLDDCVSSDVKSHYSKTINTLASRGRHLGISIGVTSQWLTSISPLQRLNSDYLFIGKTNAASIDILYNEFNLSDMTEKEFRKFVQRNTNNYSFLIINNKANNTSDMNEVYGTLKVNLDSGKNKIQPSII